MSDDRAKSYHGFGCGKVILLGEYAVIRGHGALAIGLDRGIGAWVRPGTGRIRVPQWTIDARPDDPSDLSRGLRVILETLRSGSVDLHLEAHLPAGAGLGSSAAFSVAVARAVATRCGASDDLVARAVDAAERLFHGSASGVDAAAALNGGAGWYVRGSGWQRLRLSRPIALCIGLSGRRHRTRDQVARVLGRIDSVPSASATLDKLGALSVDGRAAFVAADWERLGALLDRAQEILNGLGVSTREIQEMVELARASGAHGAKLTGAGGGGAVIALPSASPAPIVNTWSKAGYECFVEIVGRASSDLSDAPATPARVASTLSNGHG